MKKTICMVMSVMIVAGAVSGCQSDNNDDALRNKYLADNNSKKTIEQIADEYIGYLINMKYDEALNEFKHTNQMKDTILSGNLKKTYSLVDDVLGKFIQEKTAKTVNSGEYDIVIIPLQFENKIIDINIAFDKDKNISGIRFTNHINNDNILDENHVMPIGIEEKEIDIKISNGKTLPGTLTLPIGGSDLPCVILVQGSGATDRDETISKNKPFRDIAWGLAEQGIATYRYDKRSYVYPTDIIYDYNYTIDDEIVDDAIEAFELIEGIKKIDQDRVYILGHGLGGYVVPKIANGTDNAAGYIIMAGNVRNLPDIIKDQAKYLANLDEEITEEENLNLENITTQIDDLEKLDTSESKSLIFGNYNNYWIDLRDYNSIETAKSIKKPVMVLHGQRDYEVTMTEYNLWKGAFSNYKNWSYRLYPKLNHYMMEGEDKSSPEEYKIPNHVSQEVIDDIAKWINDM